MGEEKKSKKSSRTKSPKRDTSPNPSNPSKSGRKKKSSSRSAPSPPEEEFYNDNDPSLLNNSDVVTAETVLDVIPPEFRKASVVAASGAHKLSSVEPQLHYLPRQSTGQQKFPNLRVLLAAAEDDIRLHRARLQAVQQADVSLLRTYQLETDATWLARQQRLHERELLLSKLTTERSVILTDLTTPPTGLTPQEATQVQLARWQRALELYVYAPKPEDNLGLLEMLDRLSEGVAEENRLSNALEQASSMCSTLVDVTKQTVKDSTEQICQAEDAYQVRLEAHEIFARNALLRTEEIQNQFRINGRAALQIGNQLEFAERKRQRCETASSLIRRWWLLESLAEQEALSGDTLKVQEEVRGAIPLTSCRMDPLFTRPENSLEAARALRQLRQVVRSRGNAGGNAKAPGGAAGGGGGSGVDASSSRRFDLTSNLIQRTSEALEQRMLNSFLDLYAKGGTYDFTTPKRPGTIAWQELRGLAHALLLFDSGRKLHKQYVDMVITSRFPELFDKSTIKQRSKAKPARTPSSEDGSKDNDDDSPPSDDEEDEEMTLDEMRAKLSSLFHRVSEVCMQEFQLIAYVFDAPSDEVAGTESVPLTVARILCTRVIGDPKHGLQSRIDDLLESIDRKSDFEGGAKKLDMFVVIHEKAAGLFSLLKDSAERLLRHEVSTNAQNAVESLKAFLGSQEVTLNNSHRQGYLNLELRLLHHECCSALAMAGCSMLRPVPLQVDQSLIDKGILQDYTAPLVPLDKDALKRSGFNDILSGPLKQSVLRQPLICATDSLARARLMYGTGREGGEAAARVVATIYNQMCIFYGQAFLYPIMEALQEMMKTNAPNSAPQLPFDEEQTAHDLGVDSAMWVGLERIHSAAKAFDRELWAENRKDSNRVWELLANSGEGTGVTNSMAVARECRIDFFTELEQRGEETILRALDTLSAHIQWILVTGSEAMMATGGARLFNQLTGQASGPYSVSSGASLEAPNSPAVKSLCYCLRVQFVHVQAALTSQSLSAFWTALSRRIYDILITRLLQNWLVSTPGAVILARDVEALRSVSMLAGTEHDHWDILRELLTLYMTPPDALKIMLVGPEGDINSGKGLFARAGKDQSLVFMSRRMDYRYKTGQGQKKSGWVAQLLDELKVRDPTDYPLNIGKFVASRRM
eukprot:Nitzschia sp. Nitz4//scaffold143_size57137//21464//24922//NITZ4_006513-RA/size57137-processed-gene-0.48-mRNA-1//-1//CDS//3329536443//3390//frame0